MVHYRISATQSGVLPPRRMVHCRYAERCHSEWCTTATQNGALPSHSRMVHYRNTDKIDCCTTVTQNNSLSAHNMEHYHHTEWCTTATQKEWCATATQTEWCTTVTQNRALLAHRKVHYHHTEWSTTATQNGAPCPLIFDIDWLPG